MGKGFFIALGLATAIPLITLPLYGLAHWPTPIPLVASVFAIWVVTGYGHVVSTVWFGMDGGYKGIVRANRVRFMGSLAVIPMMMAAVAIADRSLSAWLYGGFSVWQAHHFGRQNYGILSFASAFERFGPLPREFGLIINLTSAAGAIGMATMPSIYPRGLPLPVFATSGPAAYGHVGAMVMFLAAGVAVARVMVTQPRLRKSPRVFLFLCLSGVFFLPSLFPGPPFMAFWPYAMAHGAQYLIFMGVTSRKSDAGWLGFAVFAVSAVGLGVFANSLRGIALVQAYTGVIMWHFIADARLWRLRDPDVRNIVRRRFDFIFGDPRPDLGPASSGTSP